MTAHSSVTQLGSTIVSVKNPRCSPCMACSPLAYGGTGRATASIAIGPPLSLESWLNTCPQYPPFETFTKKLLYINLAYIYAKSQPTGQRRNAGAGSAGARVVLDSLRPDQRPPRRLPIARRSVYVPSDHWQNVSFGICPLRREVWISLVVASKSRVHHSVWRRHVCAALSSLPLLKRCLLASLVLSSKKLFGAVIFVRRHVSH
jgi:hypothetical protein